MKSKSWPLFMLLIGVLVLSVSISACNFGRTKPVPERPTVAMASPQANLTYPLNQPVALQSAIADKQGLSRVEVWVDNKLFDSQVIDPPVSVYPAALSWTPTVPGTHIVEIRAYNISNLSNEPVQVLVTVEQPLTQAEPSPTSPGTGGEGDTLTSPTPTATLAEPDTQPGTPALTGLVDLNVRSGPGMAYPVVGKLTKGQSVQLTGQNADRSWWQIIYVTGQISHGWVSANIQYSTVDPQGNVPVVEPPPLPATTEVPPTPTPIPTVATTPTSIVVIMPGITPSPAVVAEVTLTPRCEAVSQWSPDWTPAGNSVGGTAACLYALQNLDMGGESCLSRALFSPDGREVAVKAGNGLYVISTDGTQVRRLMVPPGYSTVMPPWYYGDSEMAWSLQGDYIAYVYNDNGVRKVGVSRSRGTSTEGVWVINPQKSTAGPRWTTDGQLLVISEPEGSGSGQVYAVRLGQMPPEVKPVTPCQNYSMSASTGSQQFWPWGPGFTWIAGVDSNYVNDGRLFYTYLPDGRHSYLNPDGVNVGGREGTIYSPGGGPDGCGYPAISQVVWSPSGQYLAYEYTCGRGVGIVVHQIGDRSQWIYAAATRPHWLFDASGDYLLFTSSKGQHFVAWMSGPNDYKEALLAAQELIGPGSNTLYLSASFIEQQQPDWTAKSRSWMIGQAYGD